MCITSCPGGAITPEGKFDTEKCLSHITQKKGELTHDEISKIVDNGMIFGCDVCQVVCPHNRDVLYSGIKEFTENLIDNLYFDDIKNLSNKAFKIEFGDRAFSWRGKALLERNLKYFDDLYEHTKTES